MISAAATDIIERARAVPIEQIIAARGIKLRGRVEQVGGCPRCGGRDRFAINTKKQLWNCRGCQQGGDVIALTRFLDGSDFREACATLAGQDWGGEATATKQQQPDNAGLAAAVNRIWSEAGSPLGTLAEVYLREQRKLVLPADVIGTALRFHPRCPWRHEHALGYVPALIAPFRSIATNAVTGIHRVALNADGSKLGRRMLGSVKASAIKLDQINGTLAIAEGLESALAARQLGLQPIWATGCAAGIESFPLIGGVDHLIIVAENDNGTNRKAANKCRQTWATRRVSLAVPRPEYKDFNDALMGRENADIA